MDFLVENQPITEIFIYIIINAFLACYSFPKYHVRAFLIYSFLLPIFYPAIFSVLVNHSLYYFSPDLYFGFACSIIFAFIYWLLIFILNIKNKRSELEKQTRLEIFVVSICLQYLLVVVLIKLIFITGLLLFDNFPQFKFIL